MGADADAGVHPQRAASEYGDGAGAAAPSARARVDERHVSAPPPPATTAAAVAAVTEAAAARRGGVLGGGGGGGGGRGGLGDGGVFARRGDGGGGGALDGGGGRGSRSVWRGAIGGGERALARAGLALPACQPGGGLASGVPHGRRAAGDRRARRTAVGASPARPDVDGHVERAPEHDRSAAPSDNTMFHRPELWGLDHDSNYPDMIQLHSVLNQRVATMNAQKRESSRPTRPGSCTRKRSSIARAMDAVQVGGPS